MRRLSSIILSLVLSLSLVAQKSPHGDTFKANCDDCHKTDGWKVDFKTVSFDHNGTKFPLVGQHQAVNCKQCHTSPEFAKAQTECNSCHTDIHEQTVGNECARCHTPNSWMVTNITQLHQQSRFPLIGPHTVADCRDCHKNLLSATTPASPSASLLRFDPLGVECYDCHKEDYTTAKEPDHVAGDYPTNCIECHTINSFEWKGAGINHNFFPLEGGHNNIDCKKCHTSGTYATIPAECNSCHQPDYTSTQNPNHTSLNFSNDCSKCHSLNPGWKPAEYLDHDAQSFPIYSGKHKGEWENCSDCHTNPSNYAQFTCTDCHEHNKGDTDEQHGDVSGYEYNSMACFACHPTGDREGSFDHNKSSFPLTGAHTTTACADCHTTGYAGTPNVCASCHINNYNQSTNPNHKAPGSKFTEDCAACHTTNTGWKPATYPVHSNLEGAHVPIANDCAACHNGSYTTLPSTCYDCHTTDYTQSNNPSHASAQFPTTCADCHTQAAWKPATFNHDGQYFPIYSGKHNGEWDNCADCHTNPADYKVYTCTSTCHLKPKMDSEHQGVGGYLYNSPSCLGCHPDGTAQGFDHNAAGFPLTGGHATVLCINCHTSGYAGTSPVCAGCHTPAFNQSVNPNHTSLGIPTDCAACHTTNPGWSPATFATHNNYYVIAGAHVPIANECATCHNGNYINSPNTCFGCHASSYNQTTNPNHAAAQYATTCEDCHTQSAWSPSTFNHNTTYPLTGAHSAIASNCSQCHPNGYSNTPNTCAGCHQNNYNQATNPNHISLGVSNDCAVCHTTNPGWQPAAFPVHNNYYVLAGAHVSADCADCHNGNYNTTPNTCAGCHMNDYNQTNDPNHASAQFPTSCEDCHTQTAWQPSTFNHDGQYFPIYSGKHNGVWNTCSDCHPNSANYAVYTCTTSCHPQNSTNNAHNGVSGYQYLSSACLNCHPNGNGDKKIFINDIRNN